MSLQDLSFFLEDENEEAYSKLTHEQVATLSSGGTIEYGDTEAADKVADEIIETPADDVKPVKEESVLLAKDGIHTIPFSQLEEARERATQYESLAREQAALIESLKVAKTEDKGTGETAAQDEVLSDFAKEYPELAAALQPAIQKLIDADGSRSEVAALKKELEDMKASLAPIHKTAEDNAVDSHFKTIRDAVHDFDALVKSGEVVEWVKTLPSYARTGAESVLNNGTASEVAELFGQYKATQSKSEPAATKEQAKAAAEKAIANAQKRTVTTLTDIPAAGTNLNDEQPTTAIGWKSRFEKMSQKEILAELAR